MACNNQERKLNTRANMPSFKPDLRISIKKGDAEFSISCLLLPDGKYLIKRGRIISKKRPTATLSEIFTEARKWAVRNKQKGE